MSMTFEDLLSAREDLKDAEDRLDGVRGVLFEIQTDLPREDAEEVCEIRKDLMMLASKLYSLRNRCAYNIQRMIDDEAAGRV